MKVNESRHPGVGGGGGSLAGHRCLRKAEEYVGAEAGRSQACLRQDAVKKKESGTETNLVMN